MERIAGMTVDESATISTYITALTSRNTLVKHYKSDGTKEAGMEMYAGYFKTYSVSNLAHLQSFIGTLTSSQCLCLGCVQGSYSAEITTISSLPYHPNAVARSKQYFKWVADVYSNVASIFFFDYDDSDDMPSCLKVNSFEELRDLLIKVIPALALCQMLLRWSSSSNIIKDNGELLSAKKSIHVFIVVLSATEENVKAFKEYLNRSLWENGFAYAHLSKGDQISNRGLLDQAVLSPERPIIVSPPILPEGWHKEKLNDYALYEGGALDLDGIDYSHMSDWHPAFWDQKFALEATIERVCMPKRTLIVPNITKTPFVASASLNDKLKMIEEKLNQGGETVSVKQLLLMIDGEVTRYLLQGIGYSVDSNNKFKIREERTASASIRSDGLINDFGGDFGGNIIKFLIDLCGLSFKTSNKFVRIALGATRLRLKPSDYEPLINPKNLKTILKGNDNV